MLRSLNNFLGYSLRTRDGVSLGVKDAYFDDLGWTLRYLVVDTGTWLPGRHVLVSPASFDPPDWTKRTFPVRLTKEQIEKSPSIETDRPVSRQHEVELAKYYTWPTYWSPFAGHPPFIATHVGIQEQERAARERKNVEKVATAERENDPHLRSAREVRGYTVHAKDGEIGRTDDFVVDDQDWAIRYVAVDTKPWWPGGRVLISPNWVQEIRWSDQQVFLDMTQEEVKNSPKYAPTTPVNREYEDRLYDHYGRPRYW